MTPSRKPPAAADATADDGAGVLAATPDIDTAAFGLLPTRTEQVSVILPAEDDDDLLDDEVVADEIGVLEDPETEEVEAELVETGPFAAVAAVRADDEDVAADQDFDDEEDLDDEEYVEDDELDDETADEELEDDELPDDEAVDDDEPEDADDLDDDETADVEDEQASDDDLDDDDEADDETLASEEPWDEEDLDDEEPFDEEDGDSAAAESGYVEDEDTVDEDEPAEDSWPETDPAPQPPATAFDALIAAPTDPRVPTASSAPAARPAASAPASAAPLPAPPAPAPERAVALAASAPTTGPLDTRWARSHPDDPDRTHAVERVTTHREVSLSSRRIGEFEPNRESADLLTADRLLDPQHAPRPEPQGAWQQLVYVLSGRRINLGDGRKARARKELDRRIAAPLPGGARFVPVLSRKGGVGKTTVTTLVGMALADARDDRIIAIDANPDRGTLADRFARSSGRTVRDLVRRRDQITDYHELSSIVARDDTRLDVLSSDADPGVSEAFSDRDYQDVAAIAAHYYSIVLTDTGTGVVHSVMGATLDLADQLVVVAGLSVDEARLASETLTWLETNGYTEQVRGAVVVLNNSRPGSPMVRRSELETHFRSRVRAVVQLPYDPAIAAGSAITFRDLQSATRDAAREIAAEVVAGLQQVASAA